MEIEHHPEVATYVHGHDGGFFAIDTVQCLNVAPSGGSRSGWMPFNYVTDYRVGSPIKLAH
jgi:hypothetical protein